MPIIIPTNSAASGGDLVPNSIRMEGANREESITRTLGTASNRKKWTLSTWLKTSISTASSTIMQGGGTNRPTCEIVVNSNYILIGQYNGSAYDFQVGTAQALRDHSAWYHILLQYDSTQGTAANRIKWYINGVLATINPSSAISSYPSQNFEPAINSATLHALGGSIYGGTTTGNLFGYLAETVFSDGQVLAPTSFGEFDEDSNIWKPIKVSGLTFGTNGFYLDFKASGNLGNDANGGTDLTEVNLAATDQTTDTCTNNFATWNSLNQQSSISYSEGNTTFINSSGGNRMAFSNFGVTAGKWYAELKVGVVHNHMRLGVADISFYIPVTNAYSTNLPNSISYANDNPIYIGGSSQGDFGSFTTDDIISIVMDMDNGFVYFAKNGTYLNSGDPTSGSDGTGGFAIPNYTTKTYCFLGSSYDGGTDATVLANFGSPSYSESGGETDGNGYGNFAHAVPSGYFSLNTKNLAENG